MKESNISFSHFCDSFSDTYKDNFTYAGKRALYDYLENLEEDTGEDIELDIVALCCEYSECSTALVCAIEYGHVPDKDEAQEKQEATALEWLQEKTQVVVFDGGIIIAQF